MCNIPEVATGGLLRQNQKRRSFSTRPYVWPVKEVWSLPNVPPTLLAELPDPFPTFSAGINPARDMGPPLVTLFGHWGSDSMTDWLPFFIGPLIGGPIGAFLANCFS
jgi:hypothetical protein